MSVELDAPTLNGLLAEAPQGKIPTAKVQEVAQEPEAKTPFKGETKEADEPKAASGGKGKNKSKKAKAASSGKSEEADGNEVDEASDVAKPGEQEPGAKGSEASDKETTKVTNQVEEAVLAKPTNGTEQPQSAAAAVVEAKHVNGEEATPADAPKAAAEAPKAAAAAEAPKAAAAAEVPKAAAAAEAPKTAAAAEAPKAAAAAEAPKAAAAAEAPKAAAAAELPKTAAAAELPKAAAAAELPKAAATAEAPKPAATAEAPKTAAAAEVPKAATAAEALGASATDAAPKAATRTTEPSPVATPAATPLAVSTSPAAVSKLEQDSPSGISHATPSPPSSMPNGQSQPNGEVLPSPTTGKVQEMMRMLSPQPSSITRTVSSEKVPRASEEPASLPSSKTPVALPVQSRRTTGSIPFLIVQHDKQNTVNASQLLKLGAFKLQPLVDFVEYSELMKLRLEDGIDPTRREDYLSDEEFAKVMGMDREAFKTMPSWKKQQKKKQVGLF